MVAAYMDLTGPATEPYPFTAAAADPGVVPEVEWRDVPAGMLPPAGDITWPARASIAADTPLLPGLLIEPGRIPDDWWALPVDLPAHAAPGSDALVVVEGRQIGAVVIEPGRLDTFGTTSGGLIAVPPGDAAVAAGAVAAGAVTVLVRP